MKINKYRRDLRILQMAVAIATIPLLAFCNSRDKIDTNNLLMALAAIEQAGSKAEFKLSTLARITSSRNNDFSSEFKSSHLSRGGMDLAGENPTSYGDNDGYSNHFLTPTAVSMDVCQILAYKSVDKGGPMPGSETIDNAGFRPFKASGNRSGIANNSDVCASFTPIALKAGEGSMDSADLLITSIPSEEINNVDRIGFVVRGFSYYFEPENLPENSYRYVDLILNNPSPFVARGEVSTKIFGKGCPLSFTNSPSYIFSQLLKQDEQMGNHCTFVESAVDASSGLFLAIPGASYFDNPGAFLNAPLTTGVSYTSPNQKLKFKASERIKEVPATTPYIFVVKLDLSRTGKSNFLFNISVDNVLFWDSNSSDNVFSPQLDTSDRPNATESNDNLSNSLRKNLIFHLPTILSESK